jgi:3-hydroxyisobutyrate dehydrogenase-like beta-hydroxyacid dehydrogenase
VLNFTHVIRSKPDFARARYAVHLLRTADSDDRASLPRDLLLDTLAKTAVVALAHTGKLAAAKRNNYAPQFPIRLMYKDFGLILRASAQCGLSMPATEAAAVVNSVEAESAGEEDFSAVIRRMEEQVVEHVLPPVA